jgi:hypothetical protein
MDNSAVLTKVYARQHYLTPWRRVLLKKLVFTKLLKKFPVLNTTQNSLSCPKECVRQREGENKGTVFFLTTDPLQLLPQKNEVLMTT